MVDAGRAGRRRSAGSRAAATCSPREPGDDPARGSRRARARRRRRRRPRRARRAARACGAPPPRRRTAPSPASRRAARSARRRVASGSRRSRCHVRAALGDRVGHRADHGQHRSLGRLADRGVGARRRRSSSAASISSGSISRPGGVASFSAAPRTIWLRITPELPRAPISAARATSRTISVAARIAVARCVEPVELVEHVRASSAPCCRRCRRRRPGTRSGR